MDSENADPKGIWSDGATIRVVDSADRDLYAYTLDSGARDSAKDFTDLGDDDADYYAIWSVGDTLWLSDKTGPVVEVFDFDTGDRVSALQYAQLEPSGHDHVAGIWSDGATMWVVDSDLNLIHPYDSPHSPRTDGKSCETLNGTGYASPGGVWSDGETVWVADSEDGKIYSYNLPESHNTELRAISVGSDDVPGVGSGATVPPHRVANSSSRVTLAATAQHPHSTVYYHPGDADDTPDGHQVDLGVGSNTLTISIIAQDGATDAHHRLTVNRASTAITGWAVLPDLENVLGSGNESPGGIWSDGTYIWASVGDDLTLYAYELASGERHSDRDISLHSDNGYPKGIWSDGETMWVSDSEDGKIYSYNMPASNNAKLRSIYAAGRLLHDFDPDRHSYSLGVSSGIGQAAIQGSPRQKFATVSFTPEDQELGLGGYQINLNTGPTPSPLRCWPRTAPRRKNTR